MGRPLRIEFKNAYYHVMNQGRVHEKIFDKEEFYECFLKILAETSSRFKIEIHAYCLLPNQYHLLVKTPNENLQRAMRHLGGVYTQRYNRLNNTTGPLFRNRYKAILIDHDEHLLDMSKFIHRNPIDCKLTEDLSIYPWSSYPTYLGLRQPEPWLKKNEVLAQLEASEFPQKEYQSFITNSDTKKSILRFYNRERLHPILGNDEFKKLALAKRAESSDENPANTEAQTRLSLDNIINAVSQHYCVPSSSLLASSRGRGRKNTPRKIAMYLAQQYAGLSLSEISEAFGLNHYGGVSNAAYQVRREYQRESEIFQAVNSITKNLDYRSQLVSPEA